MSERRVAALIMAGGRSERMRADGSPQHKGLRTVRGVPLIEWNLRALLAFGFRELAVAVSAREEELAAWVGACGRPIAEAAGATLSLLVETQPLGTIGAVASLPREVDDAVVVNVDNLTELDLRALHRFHVERGAAATIATHTQPFAMPFGMLELSGDQVTAYREKPKLPVTVSSGVYVLARRAIDCFAPGSRMDVPALIQRLLDAGEPVAGFAHQAAWIDVNDATALKNAGQLLDERAARWPGAEPDASSARVANGWSAS